MEEEPMVLVIRLTTDGEAADVTLFDGTRGIPDWTPELVKLADRAGELLLGPTAMVRQAGQAREYRTRVEMEWRPVNG
jgi:hypothetical protein